MSEFINTVDVIGDNALCDQIIQRTITEYKDDVLTSLSSYAFSGCTSLRTVDLPNVTSVPTDLFKGLSSLEKASLSKLTKMSESMFYGCTKLTEVILPCVTNISFYGFYNCSSLRILDFPVVTSMGYNEAWSYPPFAGCYKLVALILRNTNSICEMKVSSPFSNSSITSTSGNGYIYVPRVLIEDYKADSNWSKYATRIRPLEDYTVDGTTTGAFDETKI